MNKIKNIHLDHLRNDEHFQFCTDMIGLVKSTGAETLKVKTQFDTFLEIYGQEDQALKKIMKSAFTEKIAEADRARDTVFSGMAETNRAALNHFSTPVREAAQRLRIVFDTYGNVARKAVAEQTSAISNLLGELEQNHTADMALAGIDSWAEELYVRNMVVQSLMKERYNEIAARTGLVMKEVRTRADNAYLAITGRIDAFALLEDSGAIVNTGNGGNSDNTGGSGAGGGGSYNQPAGEPAGGSVYADFISRLNAIIVRANDIIAARRGKTTKEEL